MTTSASHSQANSTGHPGTEATKLGARALWPWLVVCLVLLFHGLTLHEGQNWGGDWAQYVSHGMNLASGEAYNQTPYFTNRYSHVAPPIYPPVYPLLLAPLQALFGSDLEPLKWVYLICFALTLGLTFAIFSRRTSFRVALAVMLLVGLSPTYWIYKERLLSDVPFLCACMGMLYLMQRTYAKPPAERSWSSGLWIGLCMYLGYGMREVGLVLPLTAIAFEICALRRITRVLPTSLFVFGSLALLQYALIQPPKLDPALAAELAKLAPKHSNPNNHLNSFHLDPAFLWQQAVRYYHALWEFFHAATPSSSGAWELLGAWTQRLGVVLTLLGLVRSLLKGISPYEIFFGGYLLVIFCFSGFHQIRYLLPVLPGFVFYLVHGATWIGSRLKGPARACLLGGLALAATGLYGRFYWTSLNRGIQVGVTSEEARQVWDYLAQHAGPEDTIISNRPRVVGLMSQLKSGAFPRIADAQLFVEYFEIIGVDYILAMWTPHGIPTTDPELDPRAAAYLEGHQELVLENDFFKLYRFRPRPAAAPENLHSK